MFPAGIINLCVGVWLSMPCRRRWPNRDAGFTASADDASARRHPGSMAPRGGRPILVGRPPVFAHVAFIFSNFLPFHLHHIVVQGCSVLAIAGDPLANPLANRAKTCRARSARQRRFSNSFSNSHAFCKRLNWRYSKIEWRVVARCRVVSIGCRKV